MTTRLNSEQCYVKLEPSQLPEAIERFMHWAERLSSVPPDVYQKLVRYPYSDHADVPVGEFIKREIIFVRSDLVTISRVIGLSYPGRTLSLCRLPGGGRGGPADEAVLLAERLEFWSDWLAKTELRILKAAQIKPQITQVCLDVASISEAMGLPPLGQLNTRSPGDPVVEMVTYQIASAQRINTIP